MAARAKVIIAAREAASGNEESLNVFLIVCQEAIQAGATHWDIRMWIWVSQK